MSTTFTVEMAVLRRHVNFVRNGLGSSKTDLPVMMIRFEIKGNKATMFTSNKEVFARTEMKISRPSEEDPDGNFGVLGEKIESLIARVESEQVTFVSDNAENAEVSAGFLTVNFDLYDSSSIKTVETGVAEHLTKEGLTIPRAALEEALVCGKICSQASSTKMDVNHVELRNKLFLASDGRKIMIYHHSGIPDKTSLKVPSSCLNDVVGCIKNMSEITEVQVIEGASYYFLKGGGNTYTLGVRKIERSFPDIEAKVEDTSGATDEVAVDRKVLENCLRGVSLGLSADDVKVMIDLKGVDKEAQIEVSARSTTGKRSHEPASCGRKATVDVSFPVSFKHLLDTLATYKGDTVVDMFVIPKRNFLIVRDKTDDRLVTTVIPFRTDKAVEEEKKEKDAIAAEKKEELKKTTDPIAPANVESILED